MVACLVPRRRFAVGVITHPSAIVLQSAVDAVRVGFVDFHGVELAHGRAVAFDPRVSPVPRHVDPTIVAVDEVVGVGGVHPKLVVVDMHVGRSHRSEGASSVRRLQQWNACDVNDRGVGRVHGDRAEVVPVGVAHVVEGFVVGSNPGALLRLGHGLAVGQLTQRCRSASLGRGAAVGNAIPVQLRSDNFGFKQGAVAVGEVVVQGPNRQFTRCHACLHSRGTVGFFETFPVQKRLQVPVVEALKRGLVHLDEVHGGQPFVFRFLLGFPWRLVVDQGEQRAGRTVVTQPNASRVWPFGKIVVRGNACPRISAVCALPNPGSCSAFGEIMGPSGAVPRRREEVVGICLVGDHVHKAHAGHRQYGLPLGAAIGGAVQGASKVVRVEFAQGRHPHAVGVDTVKDHPSNVVAAFQSRVAPRRAVVVAEVHAVAGVGASRGIHFSGANQHPARRVGVHRAEQARLREQGFKGGAVVDAFPEATRGVGDVHRVRHDGDIHHASPHHRGSDIAQFEAACPCVEGGTFCAHTGTDVGRARSPRLGGHRP